MIIDLATYKTTSSGSAKKILCSCDVCGKSAMIPKFKLIKRGGKFDKCRICYYNRNSIKSKDFIEVECKSCGWLWLKRKDTVSAWGGLCRCCATKETANLPHVRDAQIANGIAVMQRVGKLPHYEHNYRRGPANNKWRGGITKENAKIRQSLEMKEWREAVFARDNYTCQICNTRGGAKHADHIQPFALFPNLRFSVGNGRTLCVACHGKHGAKVSCGKLIKPAEFVPSGDK